MVMTYDPDNRIYNVTVHNKEFEVTITNSSEKVSQWINLTKRIHHNRKPIIVGLDLKWCPDNFDGTVWKYGLKVKNVVDLRELAAAIEGRPEMSGWGLNSLVKEVAGLDLEKSTCVKYSDWARRTLLNNQIEYAVVRAFGSFEVGRLLHQD